MSDAEAFYCLMVGSRSFSDYEFFVTKCDHLLRNWKNIIIVSGGAYGTDTVRMPWQNDMQRIGIMPTKSFPLIGTLMENVQVTFGTV